MESIADVSGPAPVTDWSHLPLSLTPERAAAALGICAETARAMCRSGALPSVKIGTKYIISRDRLARWFDETNGRVLERVNPIKRKGRSNRGQGTTAANDIADGGCAANAGRGQATAAPHEESLSLPAVE